MADAEVQRLTALVAEKDAMMVQLRERTKAFVDNMKLQLRDEREKSAAAEKKLEEMKVQSAARVEEVKSRLGSSASTYEAAAEQMAKQVEQVQSQLAAVVAEKGALEGQVQRLSAETANAQEAATTSVANALADGLRHDAVFLVIGYLLRAAALCFVHRITHGIGDLVGTCYSPVSKKLAFKG